ncbi:hypothetical protein [uncultured Clostridium sp.]|uniref:hypothetical protein n=1 Tax=Clostridium sp. TaxID=1506 RepID=UPI0025E2BBF6|nr:hypothetical protein [uncultured Clostridium sp.]
MSFAINNYIKSSYIKKISLEKCIKNNNKLILYFSPIDYEYLNPLMVIIKNTKNREEFICPFTKELPNTLTLDLTSLCSYFTDYEGSIFINTQNNINDTILIPILPKKSIITFENSLNNTQFKWFIRILDNGELRLSSIVNKRH